MHRRGRIGRVTIDHDVNVGANLSEDRLHDETFAASRFMQNARSSGPGALGGSISGVIVKNANERRGQFGSKLLDDFRNCQLLVETRNYDGDAIGVA
jgi:hypothetical protein